MNLANLRMWRVAAIATVVLACGANEAVYVEHLDEPDPISESEELGTVEAKLATSNVTHAINFGLKLVGKPYGWWYDGPLPKGAPMWTASGAPPAPSQISSTNCTGLTNLMLRSIGRSPPADPNGFYGTGGTAAYWTRYASVSEGFNPNKTYPAGTLLMRNYRNNVDQGHVAVVLGNGRVLQSFANCYRCSAPGVNAAYTVAQSHAGYYYERAVLPQHWLGSGKVECAYGDGNYCGGNGVDGDSSTLYRCIGGRKSVLQACQNGCIRKSPGVDDSCAASTPTASTFVIDSNNAKNNSTWYSIDVSTAWKPSSYVSGYYGTGYYYAPLATTSDPATFWFWLKEGGTRAVDGRWTAGGNRSGAATFLIHDARGTRLGRVVVDQRRNGGRWQTLGTYRFTRGWNKVQLSRWGSSGGYVIADAVRIR